MKITPILEVEGLNKKFGGICAVADFSFHVNEGEVLGIIGPNGAGKTTLLNLLSGIYYPTSGRIKFRGYNIVGLPPHKICRMGIVKVHQTPRPFPSLTVLNNLIVASVSARSMKRKDAIKMGLDLLDLVGLKHLKDQQISSLKPIEVKRLEIARALACEPKIILLDEPAAGAREEDIKLLSKIIKEMCKMGITIILVEHRMDVIVKTVERLIVMNKGFKIAEGNPFEILNSEVVKRIYLGLA